MKEILWYSLWAALLLLNVLGACNGDDDDSQDINVDSEGEKDTEGETDSGTDDVPDPGSTDGGTEPPIDMICAAQYCGVQLGSCMLYNACRNALTCAGGCDPSGGEVTERCFITCFASNPSPVLSQVFSCFAENNCLPDPPAYDCPKPRNADQLAKITLDTLEGDWYVVRGLSPVYDCWVCQQMTFDKISTTQSDYVYRYDVDPDASVHNTIDCAITAIPESDPIPGRFSVEYNAYGIPGEDDWYMLSQPDSDYILIYYCGFSAMARYRGSVLMSRSPDTNVPDGILGALDADLLNADIPDPVTMSDYCIPDNSPCIP